jgi:dolichol-phosphate mannosyltransferase
VREEWLRRLWWLPSAHWQSPARAVESAAEEEPNMSSTDRSSETKVVVVLPAYNEAAVIERVLRDIHAALDDAAFPRHELVVVDDGSHDNTAAIVEGLVAELPIHLERHDGNKGLGRALRTGLVAASKRVGPDDVVLTTESDGTQPSDVLPKLARAILSGYDFAVATPLADEEGFRGVPLYRRVLSRGANVLYSGLFSVHTLRDYTNLVRGLRGATLHRAIERYGTEGIITRRGFEAVPELILKLRPLLPKIYEIPLVIDHSVLERESQLPLGRTIRASLTLIATEMLARAERRLGNL